MTGAVVGRVTRPTTAQPTRRGEDPALPEVKMLAQYGQIDDWMDTAACKGRTNLFFGIAGERPERRARREAQARKVCQSCPVLLQCRASARANRENGFWGGESEEERAAAGYPPRSISRRAVQEAAAQAS